MMYHPQSGWMPAAGQMPGQPDPYAAAAMYNVPPQQAAAANGAADEQTEGPGVIISAKRN